MYTDAAKELHAAARILGLCKDRSTPGRPESNGLAEAQVRRVLQGSRTILEHAGLEPKFWSYACQHFCFSHNHTKHWIRGVEVQEPIMGRVLPDGFRIPDLYPFGCLVNFLPSPIFLRKFPKWGTKAQPGVLLSYVTKPGGVWKGEYVVAILEDFVSPDSRPQVHTVREVIPVKKDGSFVFPLKDNYDKAKLNPPAPQSSDDNATDLQHVEQRQDEHSHIEETPFDVPPIHDTSDNPDLDASDSNPKVEDKGPTDPADTGNTADTTKHQLEDYRPDVDHTSKKSHLEKPPYVGSTTALGETTRNYKGSKRPPDIPGVLWRTLSKKERDQAHESFLKTGYGWQPAEPKGAIASLPSGSTTNDVVSHLHSLVPAMPVIASCKADVFQQHRAKIPDIEAFHRLCVARPVTKKEAAVTPAALAAMDKEWDKLEKQVAWLLDQVREWRDVCKEADARGEVVHVGRVFGILVEKGSELPKGHPDRKFKGRVVFQGNNVKDQTGDWALFEELSSAPATGGR